MGKMKEQIPCVQCAPSHPNPRLTCDGSCFQMARIQAAEHVMAAMQKIHVNTMNRLNQQNDGNK